MRFPRISSLLNIIQNLGHPVFHALSMNGWYPWALGLCLAILVGVPLAGAKIVPATPSHTQPQVKISVLDWIDSRTHTSRAERILEGREPGDLLHTLKIAMRRNPGNLSLNQKFLETLILKDRRREHRQQAIESTLWSLDYHRPMHPISSSLVTSSNTITLIPFI